MTYSINISDQAKKDLMGIFDYIFCCLKSPINAQEQLNRLEYRIMGLQTMPNRFRAYSGEPWKSRGVRLMPVDKFCVCYIVNHDDLEVYIARVMYGGRNIDEQLHKWAK